MPRKDRCKQITDGLWSCFSGPWRAAKAGYNWCYKHHVEPYEPYTDATLGVIKQATIVYGAVRYKQIADATAEANDCAGSFVTGFDCPTPPDRAVNASASTDTQLEEQLEQYLNKQFAGDSGQLRTLEAYGMGFAVLDIVAVGVWDTVLFPVAIKGSVAVLSMSADLLKAFLNCCRRRCCKPGDDDEALMAPLRSGSDATSSVDEADEDEQTIAAMILAISRRRALATGLVVMPLAYWIGYPLLAISNAETVGYDDLDVAGVFLSQGGAGFRTELTAVLADSLSTPWGGVITCYAGVLLANLMVQYSEWLIARLKSCCTDADYEDFKKKIEARFKDESKVESSFVLAGTAIKNTLFQMLVPLPLAMAAFLVNGYANWFHTAKTAFCPSDFFVMLNGWGHDAQGNLPPSFPLGLRDGEVASLPFNASQIASLRGINETLTMDYEKFLKLINETKSQILPAIAGDLAAADTEVTTLYDGAVSIIDKVSAALPANETIQAEIAAFNATMAATFQNVTRVIGDLEKMVEPGSWLMTVIDELQSVGSRCYHMFSGLYDTIANYFPELDGGVVKEIALKCVTVTIEPARVVFHFSREKLEAMLPACSVDKQALASIAGTLGSEITLCMVLGGVALGIVAYAGIRSCIKSRNMKPEELHAYHEQLEERRDIFADHLVYPALTWAKTGFTLGMAGTILLYAGPMLFKVANTDDCSLLAYFVLSPECSPQEYMTRTASVGALPWLVATWCAMAGFSLGIARQIYRFGVNQIKELYHGGKVEVRLNASNEGEARAEFVIKDKRGEIVATHQQTFTVDEVHDAMAAPALPMPVDTVPTLDDMLPAALDVTPAVVGSQAAATTTPDYGTTDATDALGPVGSGSGGLARSRRALSVMTERGAVTLFTFNAESRGEEVSGPRRRTSSAATMV